MTQSVPSDLKTQYDSLDQKLKLAVETPAAIRPDLLLSFPYEHPDNPGEITIDTDEFTAVCPWTGLPDQGTLTVRYVPDRACLELKSFKYYLLSYRSVGIVQEHAASRILEHLVSAVKPHRMSVALDYKVRGGLHTVVQAEFPPKDPIPSAPG